MSDNENALVKLSKAASLLAEAKTLDEVMDIRSKAQLAAHYIKLAGLGLEMQNDAAEVKITAERKAGAMLAKMPKMDGGDARRKSLGSIVEPSESYQELGIDKKQAHRWQKAALLPEEDFRAYLSAAKEQGQEITSRAVYNLARSHEKGESVVWEAPKLNLMDKDKGWDELVFAMYKNAIKDAAGGGLESEPAKWLLDNEYRTILEIKLPLKLIDDWVEAGCKTTPIHEVLIGMLNDRWG